MKETRELSFFKETLEKLANRQNQKRDQVLDLILAEKYGEAKTSLEELQTISVGLQVCQQTIMRDADRAAAEEQKKATLKLVENAPKQAAAVIPPKKKGWFSR